jgi:hypothetical protein
MDEAGSGILGDRPTPIFTTPERLRQFDDARTGEAEDAEGVRESQFWNSPPRYSTTSVQPVAMLSLAPRHRPSRLRRFAAALLFLALFSAVLALLAYEVSVVFGISWSDVRAKWIELFGLL